MLRDSGDGYERDIEEEVNFGELVGLQFDGGEVARKVSIRRISLFSISNVLQAFTDLTDAATRSLPIGC